MHIFVKTHRSERNVVNDEKRCAVHVNKVPGLDQACTRRKKEVGKGYDRLSNNSA